MSTSIYITDLYVKRYQSVKQKQIVFSSKRNESNAKFSNKENLKQNETTAESDQNKTKQRSTTNVTKSIEEENGSQKTIGNKVYLHK